MFRATTGSNALLGQPEISIVIQSSYSGQKTIQGYRICCDTIRVDSVVEVLDQQASGLSSS